MRRFIQFIPLDRINRTRRLLGLGDIAPADARPHPRRYRDPEQFYEQQHVPPPAPQLIVVPPPPLSSQAEYAAGAPPWTREGMPPDAEPFDPLTWIAMPVIHATNENVVLALTVPMGRDGVIELFGNQALGAGWNEGTGELIWRIRQNGAAVRNYENILSSLGNVGNPVAMGLRIFENDTIQVMLVNTAIPPAAQPVGARFHGWFYPKSHSASGWRD